MLQDMQSSRFHVIEQRGRYILVQPEVSEIIGIGIQDDELIMNCKYHNLQVKLQYRLVYDPK
jgi:hypothetical protein